MAPWLDEYAAGSLESGCEEEVEAHLLVCDDCFAAYVAMIVRGA
jgi:anti-sigma factor RsiW